MPCQLLDHGTGYLCAAAALRALARQAAHGGTQFRELALARTAPGCSAQGRRTGLWPAVTSAADRDAGVAHDAGQCRGAE